LPANVREVLSKYDSDQDGKLDAKEIQALEQVLLWVWVLFYQPFFETFFPERKKSRKYQC
jgi:hypothetical protein